MERYKGIVFRQCIKLVQNSEAAEELALDVFVGFYRAIGRIDLEAGAGRIWINSKVAQK